MTESEIPEGFSFSKDENGRIVLTVKDGAIFDLKGDLRGNLIGKYYGNLIGKYYGDHEGDHKGNHRENGAEINETHAVEEHPQDTK